MRLHGNWKQSWKWFSMHSMAISSAILASWAVIPESVQGLVSPAVLKVGLVVVLLLGMLGRLVKQDTDVEIKGE